jgi:hypothetical protein
MRTIAEFITLRFRDERAWRTAVTTFITEHPYVHVNSTGDLDLVIPQALESWVRDRLPYEYDIIRESDEKIHSPAAAAMWRDRGRGASREFDDQKWLDEQADELEKDNERLRNKIFC